MLILFDNFTLLDNFTEAGWWVQASWKKRVQFDIRFCRACGRTGR